MDEIQILLAVVGLVVTVFGALLYFELVRLNQAIGTSDGREGAGRRPGLHLRAYTVRIGKDRSPFGGSVLVLLAATDEEARGRAAELAAGRSYTVL
jgi:hypothetical protein